MVIKAFKYKAIPLVDGSYSQYFEGEPKEKTDIDWAEKPNEFINFTNYLENEVKEGFYVNFSKEGKKVKEKILADLR